MDDVDRVLHKPIVPVKKAGLAASVKKQIVCRTPNNSASGGNYVV